MIMKTVIFTFLVVGVFAQSFEVPKEQMDKIVDALKAECKKNGAEDKVEQVKDVGKNFIECVKKLVKVDELKNEIEAAKPNGALDEVFKKYCDKSGEFKACIRGLTSGVQPCLEAKYRNHIPTVENATDQLIDFVCFKDGDRIALFIAESGPECFQEKSNDIRECGTKLKESLGTVGEAQSLTRIEQCGKFDETAGCIVKSLEGCDHPTPANMAESLLKFIRNGTPCKEIKKN